MKRVALVINNAYAYAGTENICHFMSDCLGEVSEVTLFSLHGSGQPFYPYRRVKQLISYQGQPGALRKLVTRLRVESFDAIFLIGMGRLSIAFALCSLVDWHRKRGRYFACEHVAIDALPRPVRLLKYLFLRYYQQVVVLTERDRARLARWGIAATCIPNPVVRQHYLRQQRYPHALAVGRLEQQKGFDLLLPIWRDFLLTHTQWKLTIAGEGSQRQSLERQAKQLNIDHSVNFVGCVSNMARYYQHSDMLLMTSRYEGLPLVLLEAKAWALPALAYDCPTGPREIIVDQRDGFLLPAGDSRAYVAAMCRLAESDALFFAMSAATADTARNYDPDVIKQAWQALL